MVIATALPLTGDVPSAPLRPADPQPRHRRSPENSTPKCRRPCWVMVRGTLVLIKWRAARANRAQRGPRASLTWSGRCRRGGRGEPAGRRGEPVRRGLRPDDRCRARYVGVRAGRPGDAHGPPAGTLRLPGARVDDVVLGDASGRPGPDRDARCREAARAQRDGLPWRVFASSVVVSHSDLPAVARRPPGDGDVPAETDQRAVPGQVGDQPGAPIGGPGLCGRAEVELCPAGEPDGTPLLVEPDAAPARDWARAAGARALAGADFSEVAVVSRADQRLPAGRIEVSFG